MRDIINKLMDVGKAQNKLEDLLENDIFENLSKHNPYWETDPDCEKLDDCRRRLAVIKETLWEVVSLIDKIPIDDE
jgi:hypothetical protein